MKHRISPRLVKRCLINIQFQTMYLQPGYGRLLKWQLPCIKLQNRYAPVNKNPQFSTLEADSRNHQALYSTASNIFIN